MRCFRDLADVQQAVGARENFDECAEIRETHHRAEICFADLGRRGDIANHFQRGFGGGAVVCEHVHFAVVHHVNLHARGFDDRADLLPARPDQVANLVRRDAQNDGDAARTRKFAVRPGRNRLVHGVENLKPRLARLLQRLRASWRC